MALQVLHYTDVNPSLLQELSQEVSTLARIRHGYIISFFGLTVLKHEAGEYNGAIAIVTER